MAIDPRISLAVQPAGILQAAQQGLQFGQQYAQQKAMNPLQQEALKAQTGQVQAETGKLDMAKRVAGAGYMANTIQELMKMPMEQRFTHAQKAAPYVKEFGLNIDDLTPENLTDEALGSYYKVVAPLAQMAQQRQQQGLQSTGTPLIGVKNGNVVQVATTFNPNTGEYESKEIPTGLTDTQTANRYGMTAAAANQQAAERASLLGGVATQTAVNTAQATQPITVATAGETAAAKKKAEEKEQKIREVLDTGEVTQSASKNMKAALDLVLGVKDEDGNYRKANTGGVQKVVADAKAVFGWSTPDLRELEQLAMTEVIAQLNLMKGVATKSDQEAIAKLGPNPNFGNKDNIVLIKRLLRKQEDYYARAKALYNDYKDDYPQYKYVYEGGAATGPVAQKQESTGYDDALKNVKDRQAARAKQAAGGNP